MAQVGDTVRYLNSVGGGKITRIADKIAYVDEDGFETPVLLKELVVVLPAGHEPKPGGARLMFDQKAFDTGRSGRRETPAAKAGPDFAAQVEKGIGAMMTGAPSKLVENENAAAKPAPKPELTRHGDRMSLALLFEPTDIKRLSESEFNAILVNDSNYRLLFSFARRKEGERGWTSVFAGELAPNEMVDLARIKQGELGDYERVALQAVALRQDAPFELKEPFSAVRRLNLMKFYKLHCFRPGIYSDTPVLEIQLLDRDQPKVESPTETEARRLEERFGAASPSKKDVTAKTGPRKDRRGASGTREARKEADPAANPHKLLPLIEVDLHIHELTDSTVGMDNSAMMELQLAEVRKTMKAHSKRIGQKIVFIHGKGDGVLRNAVLKLLRKEYPKADLQDASFQEYGFGATLVTVH